MEARRVDVLVDMNGYTQVESGEVGGGDKKGRKRGKEQVWRN